MSTKRWLCKLSPKPTLSKWLVWLLLKDDIEGPWEDDSQLYKAQRYGVEDAIIKTRLHDPADLAEGPFGHSLWPFLCSKVAFTCVSMFSKNMGLTEPKAKRAQQKVSDSSIDDCLLEPIVACFLVKGRICNIDASRIGSL